ncbi:hypothetical protein DYBT9275_05231 [Dyadobacter sp. CECT 9275]|uniref:DUF3784 domain-containing protein n=1 Tax=Dyadobacter helix TaxID=2822344 RepID=A0A916JHH9_9BACT|nr:DUF3784 domain-containing protein [Dyadobacter sp. CECT 9275]CAG5012707.1 hypothetical protein DYBT9275_05231 [Dyadobacter sp. CECT 9275]
MLYIAAFLSVIFISVGFIITPKNARYILSGYNTMSETERAKVDITFYLRLFRRFHIFLGISLFAVTAALTVINNNIASMFMVTYPVLAYIYLVVKSKVLYAGRNKAGTYVGVFVLLIVAAVIGVSFADFKSSELVITTDRLEIEGTFGTSVPREKIDSVLLVPALPTISYKTYGFAAGDYAKGDFRTKDRRTVKLYVNKKISPSILLKTSSGDIYYNSDKLDMPALYNKIIQWKGK